MPSSDSGSTSVFDSPQFKYHMRSLLDAEVQNKDDWNRRNQMTTEVPTPEFKRPRFYLFVVSIIVEVLLMSGAFGEGQVLEILGQVGAVLSSLGYGGVVAKDKLTKKGA